MKRRFATLDVFTEHRFAGNPLAVVLQSDGLNGDAMQSIAREFNLSETVFIMPPESDAHRARVRIFTPKRELPFAGHPTVGTAVFLALSDGGAAPRRLVLEEGIGPVVCDVAPGESCGKASFELPSLSSEIGAPPPAEPIAAALGLAKHEVGFGEFVPACWSAGAPFTFVPLKTLDAIRRAEPDLARFKPTFEHPAVYVFTNETAEVGHDFHARMFAPSLGVVEDPATGSAAAAFAGILARYAANLPNGEHSFAIEQGYEMERPSLIRLGLTMTAGALTKASIGGGVVLVAEGTIEA
ncbi:MAG TPA: PhzF family phenazine biosynthesis protein [Pseudolabrys sp.]|nr:PhzF family phenazine biosynthesis protein [Pseudolabrys sp.]